MIRKTMRATAAVLGWAAAAILGWGAAAGPAQAQTEGVALRSSTWIESNYPEFARNFLLTGEALLSCRPAPQARMTCRVVRETPAGFGFGAAALEVAWGARFEPAGLKAAAAHGGALDFPVRFTQRPIPAIGGGPPTPEAVTLVTAAARLAGDPQGWAKLGREYQEAETQYGLEKLSPQVRAAAAQSFATLRAEAPKAALRVVARLLDKAVPRDDLVRAAAVIDSPEGPDLLAAFALGRTDRAGAQLALQAWAQDHPRQVADLAVVIASLDRADRIASEGEAMETFRQEVLPAFRADLCRRVTCHPADAPAP